jgi:hypothetical protein
MHNGSDIRRMLEVKNFNHPAANETVGTEHADR